MEESETHHDRAPMAGVVRELESLPGINKFLGTVQAQRNQRLRQAIGVLVRMIMERRGWRKTGKKGSLGVRSAAMPGTPNHNTGGLAFWFLRAERYEPEQGVEFPSVRKRCRELEATTPKTGARAKPSSWQWTFGETVPHRSRGPELQAPPGKIMDTFRVWVRPSDYEFLVCVDGMENAHWLIDQLGRLVRVPKCAADLPGTELDALLVPSAMPCTASVFQASEVARGNASSDIARLAAVS